MNEYNVKMKQDILFKQNNVKFVNDFVWLS